MKMIEYPSDLEIVPVSRPVHASVRVPGSKSITNRALILAALCGHECALHGALQSEDTEVMIDSLEKLGFHFTLDWAAHTVTIAENITGRKVLATHADLFVANSGTSMRFLAALCAAGEGRYRLDGVSRMRERPIQDLIDALTALGVNTRSESGNGCPPIIIESRGLSGGRIRMKADISSQFLSAVLMAAPFAKADVIIEIEGTVVSEPYIDMTLAMMKQWDLHAARTGNRYHVAAGNHSHREHEYRIEPDASAASYFFAAAAITGGEVTVHDTHFQMMQGDIVFVKCLEAMGCTVLESPQGVKVSGGKLRGGTFDMNAISDTVMTLAAVACFAEGPTEIRNVAHIRHKETDRISAVATELRKLGVTVEEYDDGLTITPSAMSGAKLATYNDHRMAMSLALIGLKVPGIVIENPGCVAKTYPGFWQDYEAIRGAS